MPLPIIRSGGIEAYCADLVMDKESAVYFLSVAGQLTPLIFSQTRYR
jgi:hypothetical protein